MLSAALRSERLRLRDFLPTDHDAYLAARRGAAFGRHARPEQRSDDFSAGLLARFIEQQRQTPRRDWQLAVVRADDGALIGSVGLRGAAGGEAEFGIELDETVWRHGYAAEAAGLMLAFGRERLSCRRFHARCAPGNVAMLALAMRLGFEMQPLRDGGRLDLLLAA
ncbi:GNAT family N-acetyltransferase [Chromobacterium sp. CV08]|uniref:GNAT family N-acetyltransferase n=1 Tax=Chromobacterium sp. CV08 TaxID=3133274 RepID=UPI003DA96EF6